MIPSEAQAVVTAVIPALEDRMSKRRVARVMKGLFGLPISPAPVCGLERRTAEVLAPIHAEVLEQIRKLPANWTFAAAEDVEPTNNAAEQTLREAVCRRKTSLGTDSRFVERILTAVESCRRQGRDLLDILVEAVSAHRSGGKPPSLIAAGAWMVT